MIKSMTGYGESKNQNDYAHIHVEISSLNSRFFEFRARTCKMLSIYDNEIKNKITCSNYGPNNGIFPVTDDPGLGIDIDEDSVRRYVIS